MPFPHYILGIVLEPTIFFKDPNFDEYDLWSCCNECGDCLFIEISFPLFLSDVVLKSSVLSCFINLYEDELVSALYHLFHVFGFLMFVGLLLFKRSIHSNDLQCIPLIVLLTIINYDLNWFLQMIFTTSYMFFLFPP